VGASTRTADHAAGGRDDSGLDRDIGGAPEPAASWLCAGNIRGDLQTRVGRVMTAHGSRRQSTTS
jgi:hypothetical protein